MICRDELIKVGSFNKLHGVQGEIMLNIIDYCFGSYCNIFFLCEIQGIFVPFKVKYCRFIFNSKALIKLMHINSREKIKFLLHKEVFLHKKEWVKSNSKKKSNYYFYQNRIGFTIIDENQGILGHVIGVDLSTINHLFILKKKDNTEFFIPATKKMIIKIDDDHKIIYMKLPKGLF